MLTSIETVFNRIWRVKETRSGIVGFMRYWTIISLGPIILGSAFVISSTVASMNLLSNNFTGYQLDGAFLLWLISFVLTILGFYFILDYSQPHSSLYAAAIAACLSAALFETLKIYLALLCQISPVMKSYMVRLQQYLFSYYGSSYLGILYCLVSR